MREIRSSGSVGGLRATDGPTRMIAIAIEIPIGTNE